MQNKQYVRIMWDQVKNSKVFVIDSSRVNKDSYYILAVYEMLDESLLDQYYIWTNTPNEYGEIVLAKKTGDLICSELTKYLTNNRGARILNINNRRRSNIRDLDALMGISENDYEDESNPYGKQLSISYIELGNIFTTKKAISYIGDYDKFYHLELIEIVVDDNDLYKYSNYIYGVNVLQHGSNYYNNIRKPRIHSVNGERLFASHLYNYISKSNQIIESYLKRKIQE